MGSGCGIVVCSVCEVYWVFFRFMSDVLDGCCLGSSC